MARVRENIVLGQVYRCPICGAELSVIRPGKGRLHPRCCNTDMMLLSAVEEVYVCTVCFSELMVIKKSSGNLEPRCCNKRMKRKN